MIERFNFTADTCNRGDLRFIGKVSRERRRYFRLYSAEYFQNHRKMSISSCSFYRETPVILRGDDHLDREYRNDYVALDNMHTVDIPTLIAAALRWQKIIRQHFLPVIVRSFWHACWNTRMDCRRRIISMIFWITDFVASGLFFLLGTSAWQNICGRFIHMYIHIYKRRPADLFLARIPGRI